MQFNRNQYFALGVVLLFLGIQFRAIESFTLNEEVTTVMRKIAKKRNPQLVSASDNVFTNLFASATNMSTGLTVQPPNWLGWVLLSSGAVLILHSFAIRPPG